MEAQGLSDGYRGSEYTTVIGQLIWSATSDRVIDLRDVRVRDRPGLETDIFAILLAVTFYFDSSPIIQLP